VNGFLYALNGVSANALSALVQRYAGRWIYAEREAGILFDFYTPELAVQPSDYVAGRCFDARFELRWQQTGRGVFDVQRLTEAPQPTADFGEPAIYNTAETIVLLWGEQIAELNEQHWRYANNAREPVWIETRIPRELRYPVEVITPRVRLSALHYFEDGILRTTRWRSVGETA